MIGGMSRSPLRNEPPLLDVERALRLVEDATLLRRRTREDEDVSLAMVLSKLPHDAALLALETATDTGDPRLLAAALDLAIEGARWDEEPTEFQVASIAQVLLPNITEIDNRVRDCARSKSSMLRAYTAKGLGERALRSMRGEGDEVDAEAASIVFALARDEDALVRKCAREALGGAAPPAWAPFFVRDPLAARPAAEAARLRGPLDRAAEALEGRIYKDATPLAEAIAELPDELAGPILDAWMRSTGGRSRKGAEPLVERWLSLGEERLFAWMRDAKLDVLDMSCSSITPALRKRSDAGICMRLAHFCDELGAREDEPGVSSRLTSVAKLLAGAWPDDADPTPLLELGLGAPLADAGALEWDEGSHTYARIKLREIALAPRPAFSALVEPLVAAFVAGCPGRWGRDSTTIRERLLGVPHPALRAHAEACLREDDDAATAWALRYLARGGHDPEHDPAPEVMLREAARDPRLRAIMLTEPELRGPAQALVRGRFAELEPREVIDLAASLLDAGEALDRGEWARVREARARIEDPTDALHALPPSELWTEEDAAFVREVVDAAVDGLRPVGALIGALMIALANRPREELLTVLEGAVERFPPAFGAVLESHIAMARLGVARELGELIKRSRTK